MKAHPASSVHATLYARWRAVVRKVDSVRGMSTLRTLRGLDSWPTRWTFARFVVESRLGIPDHGLLAPVGTAARVVHDGYAFEPRPGTVDRDVVWHFHEVQTRRLLRRHCARTQRGGVLVDVGAHCGSSSIPLESFFDRVLAVEPFPDNYRALQRNIALNDLGGKMRAFNVAAGAVRTRATLFFTSEDDTPSLVAMAAPTGSLAVEVRPLDELLGEEGLRPEDVRVLKVDVEGAELQVLAGARRILAEGSPLVMLEANTASARARLETHMEPLGYVLVRLADDRNLFFARPPS